MLIYEEATMEIIPLEDDVVRTSSGLETEPGGGGTWEEWPQKP